MTLPRPREGDRWNTASDNGRDGIIVWNNYDPISNARLLANTAERNALAGITVIAFEPWTGVDAGGNTAKQNGDPREYVVELESGATVPEALICTRNRGANAM